MIRLNSLAFKLPAFVLVAVVASLLLSAYLIDQKMMSYHRQSAIELIDESAARIKDRLWQAETALFEEGQRLLQNENLRATLALVNQFQTVEDYQSFVFDPEKQQTAEHLLNTVQNATASHAFLFDRHNALISYAKQEDGHAESGFVSYENAQPKLVTHRVNSEAPTLRYPQEIAPWQPQQVLNERYYFVDNTPFLVKSYRNFGDQNAVGTLIIASRLTHETFRTILPGNVQAYLYHPGQNTFMDAGQAVKATQKDASTRWQQDDSGFWRRITVANTHTDGLSFMLHYPTESYRLEQQATREGVLFAVAITALLILPLSFWLVRRFMVAPLNQLMHGVDRISHGDKRPMTDRFPSNELGQLADAVNAMSSTLKRRDTRLTRYAHEMERLGYVMTHHFQEPSRRLMLFSGQLQASKTCQGEDRQTADFIHQQSTRLSALVDGARRYLELLRTPPRLESINLNSVMKEVLNEPTMQERMNALRADIHVATLPNVQADAQHIRLLFHHMLDNALCYRHPERLPFIHIWSIEDTQTHKVYIQDNGVGMVAEHHPQAFSLFGRLVTSDDYPGIGLGLTLARQIMRQLEGDITVETSGPGGSVFLLLFPKDTHHESGT
ncbi:HAMP domain-containing sensor histidine kinase [Halomonas vilamensis]|uniref:histidine kinase n=1 Tax=Vreelandella vilamensis TaxID=531309 RepID=A0ABU1GZT0_9GAMM|nr:HAMP domain-containing sensor histidine kinase [Halomonas vilamensis]MDR5897575.1 HAMP domain-containing sensor histidine kinase [Halomonas vilamensis]